MAADMACPYQTSEDTRPGAEPARPVLDPLHKGWRDHDFQVLQIRHPLTAKVSPIHLAIREYPNGEITAQPMVFKDDEDDGA